MDKNGTNSGHEFQQPFSLDNALAELAQRKKMFFLKSSAYIDYVPPKLTKGKVWYISYYVRNPETGKLKRFRMKINRIASSRERLAVAKILIVRINEQLALGWNPIMEKIAPKSYCRLDDALESFLTIKGRELEGETMRVYNSYVKIFREWLQSHGYDKQMYACSFTKANAMAFMDDVDEDEDISARTFNNYLKFLRALFNWMIDKGYISTNPFAEIKTKPKKLTKKIRRIMTDEEVARLFGYLHKEHRIYLVMCLMCYCCFMRPKEIALLKCSDIDLPRQLIHIRGEIAKNDNDSYRTIPDSMMQYMRDLDLSNPDNYLFSEYHDFSFRPGKVKVCSRQIAKYWANVVRSECKFDMNLQFYSLKDTGMTNMVDSGVPLTFVQQQADHSSIAMTAIYVGKRGRQANELLKGVDIIK